MTKRLLAIDPGIEAGWAYFEGKDLKVKLVNCGLIIPSRSLVWTKRLFNLINTFSYIYSQYPIDHVYIEKPSYYSSGKGQVTAESDSLVKLSFVTGAIWLYANEMAKYVSLTSVQQWKGQLSKSLVNERIIEILKEKVEVTEEARLNLKSHAYDAVGIGLYALGLF